MDGPGISLCMTTTHPTTKLDARSLSRTQLCRAMAKALRERSGKTWSVKGGRGTAYGWLRITAPPSRRDESGRMTAEDASELGSLLGFGRPSYGESIPAGNDYWQEYADRCVGLEPSVHGVPYWD